MTEPTSTSPPSRSGRPPALRIAVTTDRCGGGVRSDVRLTGELDLATAGSFADTVMQVCRQRPDLVVLDVSDLRFVDARGLHALVRAHRDLRAAGSRLVLAHPGPHLAHVLAITAVDAQISVGPHAG